MNNEEECDDQENYDGGVDAFCFWLSELGGKQVMDGDG
jgi:hypothetical protein